jgi:hypothetical protein
MAAGLGFKDFVTGEVLTAADVDGYLMQGVWVFASAAARDSAVTSPQEGNFAYLKDTNATTYYTGSAWVSLGGAASFKGCAATQTSAQSLATSTDVAITFNAETFDTDAFHDTSSNTSRITIPAGLGGYYEFYFTVGLTAQTNGRRMCSLRLNGSTKLFTVETSELGVSFVNPTLTGTGVVNLVATDYLECVYYQDSGSSINTNGTADRVNFGVAYLGA